MVGVTTFVDVKFTEEDGLDHTVAQSELILESRDIAKRGPVHPCNVTLTWST